MKTLPETDTGGIDWQEMERRQKTGTQDISPIETRKAGVKAARAAQHQIDTYRNRGIITATQHDSAWRLLDDYRKATESPTTPLDGSPHSGSQNAAGRTDAQLDAGKRYKQAIQTVGFHQARILDAAIINEENMQAIAIRIGLGNPKAAMGAFKVALDSLGQHYRGVK